MNPLDYCTEKSIAAGYIWPYIRLYVPVDVQPALDVALAFRRELDELIERQLDPEIARLRLHWWRNEIDANKTTPSQHPLLQALSERKLESIITPGRMMRMISATESALGLTVIRDEVELVSHAENATGMVYEMLAAICTGDELAINAACKLGIAGHLLRHRNPAGGSRSYVPSDQQRLKLARTQIDHFYSLQPTNECRKLPAVWVAAKLLTAHATRASFDPQSAPIRANWIAWRAARESAGMK